jgi:hypothetical protein
MTKRFDRSGNIIFHQQTLYTLAQLDYKQKASHDYSQLILVIGPRTQDETATIISRLVERIGDLEEALRFAATYNPAFASHLDWRLLRKRIQQVLNDPSVVARRN